MSSKEVLIVGAGPTGLVLALWLTKLGVRVRIIDKTAGPGTTSRALAVQARTLEHYRQIGIDQEPLAGGHKVLAANLWVGGKRAAHIPFGRIGEGVSPFPYMLIFPQDAHENLLIEKLRQLGVEVERQTELVHFEARTSGVRYTLRHTGEEIGDVAYLMGCDGARSTVREILQLGFPGGTYAQLFYVADVDLEGPAADGELHIDLDAADFLALFPLKGVGRARLIGAVANPGDPRLGFEDVSLRAIRQMRLHIHKVNWFSTYHVHHRVAAKFRVGRVFLLGDAAHIHSPAGGQGMNTGIGDAVNLAWKLAAVLEARAKPAILDSFEEERQKFARTLVVTTDRVFTIATKAGGLARWVRTKVAPWLIPVAFKIRGIRRFLFRTVSQIRINYRRGILSEGMTVGLQAGDRLPWIECLNNFAPLHSLDWQVHVYGGREPVGLREECERLALPLHVFAEAPDRSIAPGAFYLLRPDGYVALVQGDKKPAAITEYFARWGLRVRQSQAGATPDVRRSMQPSPI